MTVHDQGDTQEAVQDGVSRAAGNERGASDRNEGSGEEPLKCPVVRPFALVWQRESRRVVHGSLVNGYMIPINPQAKTRQAYVITQAEGTAR